MGGSVLSQLFGANAQQPQYTPQNFDSNQVMDYAKSNYNYDNAKAYESEIGRQLRAKTYQDPQHVWSAVMNAQKKAEYDKAQQDAMMSSLSSQE